MDVTIDQLDDPGFVPDPNEFTLPKGAWTDSRNVEYREGAVEKCRGYTQALGDLSTTAIWAESVTDGINYFWVYGSNTVMYATDGSAHADITGPAGLNAQDDLNYTGGNFHGYVLVNDGVGVPQVWQPSLANNLESLTAWPSGVTCRVMRPHKDFIFAYRITEGGEYNPRLIRWSDRAAQSQLPQDWDFNDPTNQAGINELGQSDDQIVDASSIRDSLIIHKENHTWAAEYIGLPDVFAFRQVFAEIGLLTEGARMTFGTRQLVWSTNDIVMHDGNSAESIVDNVTRRWLFNRINTNRYKRCFIVPDYPNRKCYFCFPEAGNDWPNMALVWNWSNGKFYPYDLGGQKTYGAKGIIPGVSVSIDDDIGTFDEAVGSIDEETYNPFLSRPLLLDSLANRAYQMESGESYNGVPMQCYAERTAVPFVKDLQYVRAITTIFPIVDGTPGDRIQFHIGCRNTQKQATQWRGPFNFTIGEDHKLDLTGARIAARILDIRVSYSGTNTFKLVNYKVQFRNAGLR